MFKSKGWLQWLINYKDALSQRLFWPYTVRIVTHVKIAWFIWCVKICHFYRYTCSTKGLTGINIIRHKIIIKILLVIDLLRYSTVKKQSSFQTVLVWNSRKSMAGNDGCFFSMFYKGNIRLQLFFNNNELKHANAHLWNIKWQNNCRMSRLWNLKKSSLLQKFKSLRAKIRQIILW